MTARSDRWEQSGSSPPPVEVDEDGIPRTFPDGSPYSLRPLPPPIPQKTTRRRPAQVEVVTTPYPYQGTCPRCGRA